MLALCPRIVRFMLLCHCFLIDYFSYSLLKCVLCGLNFHEKYYTCSSRISRLQLFLLNNLLQRDKKKTNDNVKQYTLDCLNLTSSLIYIKYVQATLNCLNVTFISVSLNLCLRLREKKKVLKVKMSLTLDQGQQFCFVCLVGFVCLFVRFLCYSLVQFCFVLSCFVLSLHGSFQQSFNRMLILWTSR